MIEFGLLIPMVTIVAVFTFIAVANWADNRRKERETYHRHETYRKMLDVPDDMVARMLDFMREEERTQTQRQMAGLRLGGLITTAVGVGLAIFLYVLIDDEPIFLVGIIPFLVGLVLFAYSLFDPKTVDSESKPVRVQTPEPRG